MCAVFSVIIPINPALSIVPFDLGGSRYGCGLFAEQTDTLHYLSNSNFAKFHGRSTSPQNQFTVYSYILAREVLANVLPNVATATHSHFTLAFDNVNEENNLSFT